MQKELAIMTAGVAETGAYVMYYRTVYSEADLKPNSLKLKMKRIRNFARTWG